MTRKQKPTKRVASLVIHRANDMTKRGRKDIARWLRQHADWLEKHGQDYNPRFTGGYNYA